MKIAAEIVHNVNPVYEKASASLAWAMAQRDVSSVTFFEKNELPLDYDGYILFPYLFDTPNKIKILQSGKPFISFSSEPFDRKKLGQDYVRVLINGNVNNWGVWNKEAGISRWKKFEKILQPEFLQWQKGNVALFTPTAVSADTNLGFSPGSWLFSEVLRAIRRRHNKIIIKIHPKMKNAYANLQQKYLESLQEYVERWKLTENYSNIEILCRSEVRNLSSLDYTVCYNYVSTASIEAALAGKQVLSSGRGDFMWNNYKEFSTVEEITKNFEDLSGCVYKPEEMNKFWEYNKFYFLENFQSPGNFAEGIRKWIARL